LEPTGGALGAFVHGISLADEFTETDFQTLKQAIDEHQLLIFRNPVKLGEDDLLRFARRLGEINVYFKEAPGMPGKTKGEVWIVSNAPEFGNVGGTQELDWHTNIPYQERVAAYTLLNAVELPPSPPDTIWANLRLAYEQLDPELRAFADKSKGHYSQKGYQGKVALDASEIVVPEAVNSLVRTNHSNGRKSLYEIGRRLTAGIEGLDPKESQAFLEKVLAFATQPKFLYAHKWQPGDTIVWDNLSSSHKRDPFSTDARRVMRVIDILEDEPSGTKPLVPFGQILPENLAAAQ